MQACTPFKAKVVAPLRDEKNIGLKKGSIHTIRFFYCEQRASSLLIYFVVWNEKAENWKLEEAVQFAPVEG